MLYCIMSGQTYDRQEINEAVLKVGKGSLEVIQRFLSGRETREVMIETLTALEVNDILNKYWNVLTSDAKLVPHWRVLQTLQGMVDEMTYQIAEYGESSLFDDVKEVAACIKLITNQNDDI